MVDFDALNRQTKEHNARSCPAPSQTTPTMRGTQRTYNEYWQNQYNNQTYKENNGTYSKHY